MAGYTGNVFGTRVLAWGTINLDNFLIGRFVGALSAVDDAVPRCLIALAARHHPGADLRS